MDWRNDSDLVTGCFSGSDSMMRPVTHCFRVDEFILYSQLFIFPFYKTTLIDYCQIRLEVIKAVQPHNLLIFLPLQRFSLPRIPLTRFLAYVRASGEFLR